MSSYKCECGQEFTEPQKFNGHKGHCRVHLAAVGKLEFYADRQARASATGRKAYNQQQKDKKQQILSTWISEQHICERCGIVMTEKFGSGRFCSRACANTRERSSETKEKIRLGLESFHQSRTAAGSNIINVNSLSKRKDYEKNFKKCSICGKNLPYEKRFQKTCSADCLRIAYSNVGKRAASALGKRSKNEIAFCTLCEDYFGLENVLHNKAMFNGWDADIILINHKLAILWNGPWHYRKVTRNHSLEQVQNRDKIKLNEIINCGFTPYIIKDLSKENSDKVTKEFELLLDFLKNRVD